MLKIGQHVSISFEKQTIVGKVIGIDFYHLENFDGDSRTWPSYTIVSDAGKKFTRYWLTDWSKDGWLLWLKSKPINSKTLKKPWHARSGVAQIQFKGDRGASTPTAALIVYQQKANLYYSAERFIGSEIMYFSARKIEKPKAVKA